jgi:hypothetical protein
MNQFNPQIPLASCNQRVPYKYNISIWKKIFIDRFLNQRDYMTLFNYVKSKLVGYDLETNMKKKKN